MQPNANNNVMGNASQAAPQTMPASQNVNMMAQGAKPKNNKGMMIGMIVLAILAVGGIGFGVWAFLSGNQKEDKISELNNQVSSLQSQLAEQPETDETVIEVDTDSTTDTAKYIYIGEWGLKLKLPEDLHEVSYKIQNTHENEGPWYSNIGTSMLSIEGWNNAEDAITYSSEASTSGSCNSAAVIRSPKGQISSESPAFTIGDYDFHFLGWQAPCSTPETTQTGTLLRDIILNPDNYSAI